MKRRHWYIGPVLLLALVLIPGTSRARGLSVEVWTDRGNDAVYEPGDRMQVKIRTSDDAHVLVYEIDAEGFVHVLSPYQGRTAFMEGRHTYRVPSEDDDVELLVQKTVGQAYIVALASVDPFDNLPWYLRPYNPQGEGVGYVGQPEDEEGVTAEGRIVGDPFVAMEHIRRRVLKDPEDANSFASAYTDYYVHHEVRYPRYLCYDCHRPGRWAWWDDFDPYYANCSVFDVRVNWSWYWGPSYWFGRVPYFVYVYRSSCPPRYASFYRQGVWYSSWDGWNRWSGLWGTNTLTRYKSPPPPGYIAPTKFDIRPARSPAQYVPPGFLSNEGRVRRDGQRPVGIGKNSEAGDGDGRSPRESRFTGGLRRGGTDRSPAIEPRGDDRGSSDLGRRRGEERPEPGVQAPRGEGGPQVRPRQDERPSPRIEPRQEQPPAPRVEPRREQPPAPRVEPRREERPSPRAEPAREAKPREAPPAEKSDEGRGRGKRGGP